MILDVMDPKWQNVAVYYYEEEKDQLILDCIQPLFQSLAPQVERAFFIRHWVQGPHLRLRFFTTDRLFTEVVKPAIEEQVGHYLQEYPSTKRLNEETLRPSYEKLALIEQENGPVLPLYPNNSIQYLPYDRRLHVLRSDLLADLIENFYVETSDLTFQMLEYIRQGHSRLALSLDLMFTTAHKTVWPITNGFISFRSHAEGFIMRLPNPAATRNLFEKKYVTQAESLTARLCQVLEALDHEQETLPFLLSWVALMKRNWSYSVPLIETKVLDLIPNYPQKSESYEERLKKHLPYSTFHTHFYENESGRKRLLESSYFQGYRVALNLLYLHLNRLGINSVERALLGHLAANTVEEVFKISATGLMAGVTPNPVDVNLSA